MVDLESRVIVLEAKMERLISILLPKTEHILRDQDETIKLLREHRHQLNTLLGMAPFRRND